MNPSPLSDLLAVLDLASKAGATRYFQTPPFGAVAALTDSVPQPIRFTRFGYVVSILGSIQSGAVADYAATTLRVQIGGTEDLFVDGQGGPAFVPFLALFGGIVNERRCLRRVAPGDLWTFTCHDNAAAGSVTPLVQVSFLDDEDVARALAAMAKIRGRA